MKLRSYPLILCALTACATSGTKLSDEQLKKIKVGKTKYADLVGIAGEPTMEQDQIQNGALPKLCGKTGDQVKHLMYSGAAGNIVSGTKSESRSFYLNNANVVCHSSRIAMNVPVW